MINSDNKNDLHVYLAEKFVETSIFQKHLVITYNDSILTNIENIVAEDEISNCDIEEADQRIIRHLINCAKNEFKKLFLSTGDTDVLILLMSVLPNILKNFQCELICQFGIGDNLRYYKVNDLCSSLINNVCIALSFFHAFRGCDTTSSFHNHSKFKFFDFWMKCNEKDDLTNLFKELRNEPLRITDNHLNILEKFVLSVYYPKRSSFKSIDHADFRSIPFSRKGLKEHTKRACLRSG